MAKKVRRSKISKNQKMQPLFPDPTAAVPKKKRIPKFKSREEYARWEYHQLTGKRLPLY